MFRWFKKNKSNDAFVSSPLHDNWYQSSSYYASTFALVTTVDEHGETNIGPYQLTFPFEVIGERSLYMISRSSSNTAQNLLRTKKCVLNYVEYSRPGIRSILNLGYPGQTTAEKVNDNIFELCDSPTSGRRSGDGIHPKIIKEAFQVYECSWDSSRDINQLVRDNSSSTHFILNLDNILLKQSWLDNLEDGGKVMPQLPITMGFRGGSKFWFAQMKKPFSMPPPDKGPKHEAIMYEGNRIDSSVRFTEEACKQLTGIPRPFLRTALKGIVKEAKSQGIELIDEAFVKALNEKRNKGD